ncbi:eukaryotic aspartyl protease family protein, putative (macronuclear) [Tetrahymena thermophila SB210]|uniref:Eukaryotic aspartyl protease family protein, putative n=1 Tax=Tetrahymena thermophila (strain SB210) TaxID=312017 RepID=I7M0P1_TETTS|nr:eukaryotic aspartyl protease family protein, putative [Tetrahymena thermophila SB210]EAR89964.2 eukaryotic aspartyl protease family protein, putative [Tetrahymena thermophila SB210]|eukprot:XP_001010209.2 eukaryotic aspartyl protease family protein, putative [Tetrahymena thermophila SB210]
MVLQQVKVQMFQQVSLAKKPLATISFKSYLQAISHIYKQLNQFLQIFDIYISLTNISKYQLLCQQLNICLKQIKFNFNKQAEGVLGMQMFSFYKPNGNSYVANLFKNGNIQQNMFSFYFGSTPQLTVGGFDASSVQNVSNINYHNVVMNGNNDNTQQWVVRGSQLVVGNFSQYFLQGYNLVQVSTADSYIKVSEDIFVNLMRYFINNLKVQKQGSQYTLPCSQKFPNFVLYLPDNNGNMQIYNLTSDYFINKQSDTCFLMIADLGYQQTVKIVLGTPFLQKYVSIFSMNNATIGFSLASVNSSSGSSSLPGWAIALIVIACIIIVALILFFLYRKWRSNKDRDFSTDSNGDIITYSKRQSNFNNSNNKANASSANNISTNLSVMNTSNQVVSNKNQNVSTNLAVMNTSNQVVSSKTNGNVTIQTGNFSSSTVTSSKQVVSSQQISTQKIVTSTSTSSKQVTSTSKYEISNNNNF